MTDLAALLDAAYATPCVGNAAQHGKRERRSVTDTKKRLDVWAECLVAVRDAEDAAAFARLFAHFAPRVKSFLLGKGASNAQAEEAMQEAMATVWFKARLFDPQRATASTWIFTIARNKFLDAIRKTNRPEPEELEWEGNAPEDPSQTVATAQEADLLKEAVARLPDGQREIVQKAYFGDLSHNEIAEVTGLPLGTIKSRIRLALERLRRDLGELT